MGTKAFFLIFILCIFCTIKSFAQQITVSGFVNDNANGERLIGANVIIEDGAKSSQRLSGTVSDKDGYYRIVVSPPVKIRYTYIGYTSQTIDITETKSISRNISLEPTESTIEGVEIIAQEEKMLPQFNVSSLSAKEIERIPSLGGKADVLKAALLLPGIETTNEASSLLLVRGGNPGENMFLLDNVPLIYVNHLGGFMSVFNTDMINSMTIYKGGFPAKYGGKLSSVIELAQREGDKHKLKGSINAGVTDVGFTIEGPTPIKNSSFIITGRKTLLDYFMMSYGFILDLAFDTEMIPMFGFHDVNGKFTWRPDDKNTLSLNVYQGDDYLKIWGDEYTFSNIWGNVLVAGNWDRVISPKLMMSNTLSYVRYRTRNAVHYESTRYYDTTMMDRRHWSKVNDISFRSLFKYSVLKKWDMEFGINSSFFLYNPNDYSFITNLDTIIRKGTLNSFENSIFIDNKISLFKDVVNASLGARLVHYNSSGYQKLSIEPRANVNINVNENHIINLSYMRVTQNSHMIFTPGFLLNDEMWLPAGDYAPTSSSDQYSIGWQGKFLDNQLQTELGVYYKTLNDLVIFKEGLSSMEGDMDWRNKLEVGGIGKSKGVEMLIRKPQGKITGFLAYTLSRTTRQFENINDGKEFVFEFDRTHSISINAAYKINKKWSVSATWNYSTGTPFTPIIGKYLTFWSGGYSTGYYDDEGNFIYDYVYIEHDLQETAIYGERNSERTQSYHRLDLGAVYSKIGKRGRNVEWTFSIYNAYNRKNPFQYYYSTVYDYANPDAYAPIKLHKMSIFPIIPSVSYKVYF